jgi:hypothetical protein
VKEEGCEIILGGDVNEKQNNDNLIADITEKMNIKEILRRFKKDISTLGDILYDQPFSLTCLEIIH